MCVYWGKEALRDPGSNGVAFEISAVSGELLEMNVGNSSGCKGLPLIKDLDKLLAISDSEFLNDSDAQRDDLLAHYTVNPSLITPEAKRLGLMLATNTFSHLRSPKAHAVTNAPQLKK